MGQMRTARRARPTRTGRRRRAVATSALAVGALAALTAANGASASAGGHTTTTTPGPPAHSTPTGPPISLGGGKSVTPTLGDWEGTVGGLPASFDLTRDPRRAGGSAPPYGIDELVAITPSACPVSPAQVREVQLKSSGPVRLGAQGALGLGHIGFGGELTGNRTATLTRAFHLAGCNGTQTWAMHPALRLPVSDGNWNLRMGSSPLGHFTVSDGGRLASAVPLSKDLELCEGLTGTVDVFIGPGGIATTDDPELQISLHFVKGVAHGTFTTRGKGCATRHIPVSAALAGQK
jgi:hypothetical protein